MDYRVFSFRTLIDVLLHISKLDFLELNRLLSKVIIGILNWPILAPAIPRSLLAFLLNVEHVVESLRIGLSSRLVNHQSLQVSFVS